MTEFYKIIFAGYQDKTYYKKFRINVDIFIEGFFKGKVNPSLYTPLAIADGVSLDSANLVRSYLNQFGCLINIAPSSRTDYSEQEQLIQEWFAKASEPIRCPRCGSTAITTGERGYSLLTGFLGSNKTVNRCGKCGYSWEP